MSSMHVQLLANNGFSVDVPKEVSSVVLVLFSPAILNFNVLSCGPLCIVVLVLCYDVGAHWRQLQMDFLTRQQLQNDGFGMMARENLFSCRIHLLPATQMCLLNTSIILVEYLTMLVLCICFMFASFFIWVLLLVCAL